MESEVEKEEEKERWRQSKEGMKYRKAYAKATAARREKEEAKAEAAEAKAERKAERAAKRKAEEEAELLTPGHKKQNTQLKDRQRKRMKKGFSIEEDDADFPAYLRARYPNERQSQNAKKTGRAANKPRENKLRMERRDKAIAKLVKKGKRPVQRKKRVLR